MARFLPTFTKRGAAAFTTFAFIFTTLLPPGFSELVASFPERIPAPRLELHLPLELGKVEETHLPRDSSPIIFHIQTAHGDLGSQKRVRELLEFLHKTHGIDLVFAEGASEKLKPELLRFFPERSENLKLTNLLLEKGLLTGIDLFLAEGQETTSNQVPVEILGIEDAGLYRSAYKAFQKVFQNAQASDEAVRKIELGLDKRASKILSRELLNLVKEWQRFQEAQSQLLSYARFLQDRAKKDLQLDFKNPFLQIDWPQMVRLARLLELEKTFNQKAFEKEEEKLKQTFPELSPSELKESPRLFFERQVEKAFTRGFRFEDFPEFTRWMASEILRDELHGRPLSEELDRVWTLLKERLSEKEVEREMIREYETLALLKKLFRLELTREEWEQVRTQASSLRVRHDFWRTKQSQSSDDIQKAALSFYRLVEKRESVFFERLKRELASRKKTKAILVTGGFHTQGVSEILKQSGFGYVIISPRMGEEVSSDLYRKTMLDLAQLEKIQFAQTLQTKRRMGLNLRIELGIVREAYREILKRFDSKQIAALWSKTLYVQANKLETVPAGRSEARSPKGKREIRVDIKKGIWVGKELTPWPDVMFYGGGGGDSPGLSPAYMHAIFQADKRGKKLFGIDKGLEALGSSDPGNPQELEEYIKYHTPKEARRFRRLGSTPVESVRYDPFTPKITAEGRKEIAEKIKKLEEEKVRLQKEKGAAEELTKVERRLQKIQEKLAKKEKDEKKRKQQLPRIIEWANKPFGMILFGGDDHAKNVKRLREALRERESKTFVQWLPKTIDGDILITEALGTITAVEEAREKLHSYAQHAKGMGKIIVAEGMGRTSGFLIFSAAKKNPPKLDLRVRRNTWKKRMEAFTPEQRRQLMKEVPKAFSPDASPGDASEEFVKMLVLGADYYYYDPATVDTLEDVRPGFVILIPERPFELRPFAKFASELYDQLGYLAVFPSEGVSLSPEDDMLPEIHAKRDDLKRKFEEALEDPKLDAHNNPELGGISQYIWEAIAIYRGSEKDLVSREPMPNTGREERGARPNLDDQKLARLYIEGIFDLIDAGDNEHFVIFPRGDDPEEGRVRKIHEKELFPDGYERIPKKTLDDVPIDELRRQGVYAPELRPLEQLRKDAETTLTLAAQTDSTPEAIDKAIGQGFTEINLDSRSLIAYIKRGALKLAFEEVLRKSPRLRPEEVMERLMEYMATTGPAAILKKLSPVYEDTKGRTGYVSFEIDPTLEDWTKDVYERFISKENRQALIRLKERYGELAVSNPEEALNVLEEMKELAGPEAWEHARKLALAQAIRFVNTGPNVLAKIQGTELGLEILRDLTALGINTAVDLIFTPERTLRSDEAFREGLQIGLGRDVPGDGAIKEGRVQELKKLVGLVRGLIDEKLIKPEMLKTLGIPEKGKEIGSLLEEVPLQSVPHKGGTPEERKRVLYRRKGSREGKLGSKHQPYFIMSQLNFVVGRQDEEIHDHPERYPSLDTLHKDPYLLIGALNALEAARLLKKRREEEERKPAKEEGQATSEKFLGYGQTLRLSSLMSRIEGMPEDAYLRMLAGERLNIRPTLANVVNSRVNVKGLKPLLFAETPEEALGAVVKAPKVEKPEPMIRRHIEAFTLLRNTPAEYDQLRKVLTIGLRDELIREHEKTLAEIESMLTTLWVEMLRRESIEKIMKQEQDRAKAGIQTALSQPGELPQPEERLSRLLEGKLVPELQKLGFDPSFTRAFFRLTLPLWAESALLYPDFNDLTLVPVRQAIKEFRSRPESLRTGSVSFSTDYLHYLFVYLDLLNDQDPAVRNGAIEAVFLLLQKYLIGYPGEKAPRREALEFLYWGFMEMGWRLLVTPPQGYETSQIYDRSWAVANIAYNSLERLGLGANGGRLRIEQARQVQEDVIRSLRPMSREQPPQPERLYVVLRHGNSQWTEEWIHFLTQLKGGFEPAKRARAVTAILESLEGRFEKESPAIRGFFRDFVIQLDRHTYQLGLPKELLKRLQETRERFSRSEVRGEAQFKVNPAADPDTGIHFVDEEGVEWTEYRLDWEGDERTRREFVNLLDQTFPELSPFFQEGKVPERFDPPALLVATKVARSMPAPAGFVLYSKRGQILYMIGLQEDAKELVTRYIHLLKDRKLRSVSYPAIAALPVAHSAWNVREEDLFLTLRPLPARSEAREQSKGPGPVTPVSPAKINKRSEVRSKRKAAPSEEEETNGEKGSPQESIHKPPFYYDLKFVKVLFTSKDSPLTPEEKELIDLRYGLFKRSKPTPIAQLGSANPYIEILPQILKINERVGWFYEAYVKKTKPSPEISAESRPDSKMTDDRSEVHQDPTDPGTPQSLKRSASRAEVRLPAGEAGSEPRSLVWEVRGEQAIAETTQVTLRKHFETDSRYEKVRRVRIDRLQGKKDLQLTLFKSRRQFKEIIFPISADDRPDAYLPEIDRRFGETPWQSAPLLTRRHFQWLAGIGMVATAATGIVAWFLTRPPQVTILGKPVPPDVIKGLEKLTPEIIQKSDLFMIYGSHKTEAEALKFLAYLQRILDSAGKDSEGRPNVVLVNENNIAPKDLNYLMIQQAMKRAGGAGAKVDLSPYLNYDYLWDPKYRGEVETAYHQYQEDFVQKTQNWLDRVLSLAQEKGFKNLDFGETLSMFVREKNLLFVLENPSLDATLEAFRSDDLMRRAEESLVTGNLLEFQKKTEEAYRISLREISLRDKDLAELFGRIRYPGRKIVSHRGQLHFILSHREIVRGSEDSNVFVKLSEESDLPPYGIEILRQIEAGKSLQNEAGLELLLAHFLSDKIDFSYTKATTQSDQSVPLTVRNREFERRLQILKQREGVVPWFKKLLESPRLKSGTSKSKTDFIMKEFVRITSRSEVRGSFPVIPPLEDSDFEGLSVSGEFKEAYRFFYDASREEPPSDLVGIFRSLMASREVEIPELFILEEPRDKIYREITEESVQRKEWDGAAENAFALAAHLIKKNYQVQDAEKTAALITPFLDQAKQYYERGSKIQLSFLASNILGHLKQLTQSRDSIESLVRITNKKYADVEKYHHFLKPGERVVIDVMKSPDQKALLRLGRWPLQLRPSPRGIVEEIRMGDAEPFWLIPGREYEVARETDREKIATYSRGLRFNDKVYPLINRAPVDLESSFDTISTRPIKFTSAYEGVTIVNHDDPETPTEIWGVISRSEVRAESINLTRRDLFKWAAAGALGFGAGCSQMTGLQKPFLESLAEEDPLKIWGSQFSPELLEGLARLTPNLIEQNNLFFFYGTHFLAAEGMEYLIYVRKILKYLLGRGRKKSDLFFFLEGTILPEKVAEILLRKEFIQETRALINASGKVNAFDSFLGGDYVLDEAFEPLIEKAYPVALEEIESTVRKDIRDVAIDWIWEPPHTGLEFLATEYFFIKENGLGWAFEKPSVKTWILSERARRRVRSAWGPFSDGKWEELQEEFLRAKKSEIEALLKRDEELPSQFDRLRAPGRKIVHHRGNLHRFNHAASTRGLKAATAQISLLNEDAEDQLHKLLLQGKKLDTPEGLALILASGLEGLVGSSERLWPVQFFIIPQGIRYGLIYKMIQFVQEKRGSLKAWLQDFVDEGRKLGRTPLMGTPAGLIERLAQDAAPIWSEYQRRVRRSEARRPGPARSEVHPAAIRPGSPPSSSRSEARAEVRSEPRSLVWEVRGEQAIAETIQKALRKHFEAESRYEEVKRVRVERSGGKNNLKLTFFNPDRQVKEITLPVSADDQPSVYLAEIDKRFLSTPWQSQPLLTRRHFQWLTGTGIVATAAGGIATWVSNRPSQPTILGKPLHPDIVKGVERLTPEMIQNNDLFMIYTSHGTGGDAIEFLAYVQKILDYAGKDSEGKPKVVFVAEDIHMGPKQLRSLMIQQMKAKAAMEGKTADLSPFENDDYLWDPKYQVDMEAMYQFVRRSHAKTLWTPNFSSAQEKAFRNLDFHETLATYVKEQDLPFFSEDPPSEAVLESVRGEVLDDRATKDLIRGDFQAFQRKREETYRMELQHSRLRDRALPQLFERIRAQFPGRKIVSFRGFSHFSNHSEIVKGREGSSAYVGLVEEKDSLFSTVGIQKQLKAGNSFQNSTGLEFLIGEYLFRLARPAVQSLPQTAQSREAQQRIFDLQKREGLTNWFKRLLESPRMKSDPNEWKSRFILDEFLKATSRSEVRPDPTDPGTPQYPRRLGAGAEVREGEVKQTGSSREITRRSAARLILTAIFGGPLIALGSGCAGLIRYSYPKVRSSEERAYIYYGTHSGRENFRKAQPLFDAALSEAGRNEEGELDAFLMLESVHQDVALEILDDWPFSILPPLQRYRTLEELLKRYREEEKTKKAIDTSRRRIMEERGSLGVQSVASVRKKYSKFLTKEGLGVFWDEQLRYAEEKKLRGILMEEGLFEADVLILMSRTFAEEGESQLAQGNLPELMMNFKRMLELVDESTRLRDDALNRQFQTYRTGEPQSIVLHFRGSVHQWNHELIARGISKGVAYETKEDAFEKDRQFYQSPVNFQNPLVEADSYRNLFLGIILGALQQVGPYGQSIFQKLKEDAHRQKTLNELKGWSEALWQRVSKHMNRNPANLNGAVLELSKEKGYITEEAYQESLRKWKSRSRSELRNGLFGNLEGPAPIAEAVNLLTESARSEVHQDPTDPGTPQYPRRLGAGAEVHSAPTGLSTSRSSGGRPLGHLAPRGWLGTLQSRRLDGWNGARAEVRKDILQLEGRPELLSSTQARKAKEQTWQVLYNVLSNKEVTVGQLKRLLLNAQRRALLSPLFKAGTGQQVRNLSLEKVKVAFRGDNVPVRVDLRYEAESFSNIWWISATYRLGSRRTPQTKTTRSKVRQARRPGTPQYRRLDGWSGASAKVQGVEETSQRFDWPWETTKKDWVAVSQGNDLYDVFIGSRVSLARTMQAKLPDLKTFSRKTFVLGGVTYTIEMNATHRVWSFKKKDSKKVGKYFGFTLKEARSEDIEKYFQLAQEIEELRYRLQQRSEVRTAFEVGKVVGAFNPNYRRNTLLGMLRQLRSELRRAEQDRVPDYLKEILRVFQETSVPLAANDQEVGGQIFPFDHVPSEPETAALAFSLGINRNNDIPAHVVIFPRSKESRENEVKAFESKLQALSNVEGKALNVKVHYSHDPAEIRKRLEKEIVPSLVNALMPKLIERSGKSVEEVRKTVRQHVVVSVSREFMQWLEMEEEGILGQFTGMKQVRYDRPTASFLNFAVQSAAVWLSKRDYERLGELERAVLVPQPEAPLIYRTRYDLPESLTAAWLLAEARLLQALAQAA